MFFMPILWRYLLRNYLQVLALCVCAFITILLVTRFTDIASFASSGAPISVILIFTLLQIPHILPIAIPISGLIAAMILFQKMSHTQELTAFRACGLGIKAITFPLILAGAILCLVNFTISSEIAPRCRVISKNLIYKMTASNPLVLFQKKSLVRLKDAHIDMSSLEEGKHAKDLVLIMKNLSHERLGLMVAKELTLDGDSVNGNQVTFISSMNSKNKESYDHLIIENQAAMNTASSPLTQFLNTNEWQTNFDHMPFRLVVAQRMLEHTHLLYPIGRAHMEIARRLSISLAAFTFTLLGIAYGMEISRTHSKKGIFWALGLASLFLVCFIAAKSFYRSPAIATLILLIPHPIIIFFSLNSIKRVSRGQE
jgi:lipopolysaccharide export system permease protein